MSTKTTTVKSGKLISDWVTGRNGDFRIKTEIEIFEADFYGKGPKKYAYVTKYHQQREFCRDKENGDEFFHWNRK